MAVVASRRQPARRALDRRGAQLRQFKNAGARPSGGWMRAIREALGMSVTDLAGRMNVAPSTVHRLEVSEQNERIQLDSLRRAADALDCDLVYALVPRRPLQELVDERARESARLELAALGHTMDLEAQGLGRERLQERVDELADQIKARPGLWQE